MKNLNQEILDVILDHETFEEIATFCSSEYLGQLVKVLECDIQNSLVSRLDNTLNSLLQIREKVVHTKIKFQNSKQNRKALVEAGYRIYDPHCTFNRKAWIIIGTDDLLYGVNRRNFPVVDTEEFLGMNK